MSSETRLPFEPPLRLGVFLGKDQSDILCRETVGLFMRGLSLWNREPIPLDHMKRTRQIPEHTFYLALDGYLKHGKALPEALSIQMSHGINPAGGILPTP